MTKEPISKKDRIRVRLNSTKGTTIASLMKLTDWQEHSVRSALSTLRKSGDNVVCIKQIGKPSIYRIEPAARQSAKTAPGTDGRINNA